MPKIDSDVLIQMRRGGASADEIAKKFNTSRQAVYYHLSKDRTPSVVSMSVIGESVLIEGGNPNQVATVVTSALSRMGWNVNVASPVSFDERISAATTFTSAEPVTSEPFVRVFDPQ